MIGLIQKVLMDLVRDQGGEKAVQAVCARAGVNSATGFRIDTDYADSECLALLEATGDYFGLDETTLYQRYADHFIVASRRLFPMFYQMSGSAREFLKRQPKVHSTLAASLRTEESRDRVRDKFAVQEEGDALVVTYSSPNRLCGLYEALFQRLLTEYGETGTFEVRACQKQGADACRFCLRTEADHG